MSYPLFKMSLIANRPARPRRRFLLWTNQVCVLGVVTVHTLGPDMQIMEYLEVENVLPICTLAKEQRGNLSGLQLVAKGKTQHKHLKPTLL